MSFNYYLFIIKYSFKINVINFTLSCHNKFIITYIYKNLRTLYKCEDLTPLGFEAATFMIRNNKKAQKYYHRKKAKTNKIIAKTALANKIARACFYILRDKVEFNDKKLFGA